MIPAGGSPTLGTLHLGLSDLALGQLVQGTSGEAADTLGASLPLLPVTSVGGEIRVLTTFSALSLPFRITN